jgi:uncharacterized protein YegL
MDTTHTGASVSERVGISEQLIVLPVYLVVDTSASLTGEIDSINAAAASLLRSLAADPVMAGAVRVSLIEFSDDARTVIPLSDVTDVTRMPTLVAGGTTNYSAAFSLVRQVIPKDVANLKNEGFKVFRPVMFFMTDGSPTDQYGSPADQSWQTTLEELRPPKFRQGPTIVAIGFGSADPVIIREIGSGRGGAFMISDAISAPDAIRSIWSPLTSMVTATVISSSGDSEAPPIQVPPEWLNLS